MVRKQLFLVPQKAMHGSEAEWEEQAGVLVLSLQGDPPPQSGAAAPPALPSCLPCPSPSTRRHEGGSPGVLSIPGSGAGRSSTASAAVVCPGMEAELRCDAGAQVSFGMLGLISCVDLYYKCLWGFSGHQAFSRLKMCENNVEPFLCAADKLQK